MMKDDNDVLYPILHEFIALLVFHWPVKAKQFSNIFMQRSLVQEGLLMCWCNINLFVEVPGFTKASSSVTVNA